MATRLKTIEYWLPHLATIADNVATNFTQITVYIPDAVASNPFKSVFLDCIAADIYTSATNLTVRKLACRVASESYTTASNTQTFTQSGENFTFHVSQDVTSSFNTWYGNGDWSSGSATFDCQITVNGSAAGTKNASCKLVITYEYDDEEVTQIKTAYIPLNAPNQALASSKPGTANATIPLLDTYCPEASKTFRQTSIVVQGNTESNSSTNISLSFQVDSAGSSLNSQVYVKGTTTDLYYRLNEVVSFTTSGTHDFYIWASTTDFDHPQVWLVVTYEFNSTTTTSVLNTLLLPCEFDGGAGITTNSLYQRAKRELWIEEPTTITVANCAVLVFYDQKAAVSGIQANFNGGGWTTYTSVGTVSGGGFGFMLRNDSISLARGRNSLYVDVFCTDTADAVGNASVLFMINYTSGVATDGVGAHNRTIQYLLLDDGGSNIAARCDRQSSSLAVDIPETNYFITSIGTESCVQTDSTNTPQGNHIGVERKSGEGGHYWEGVYECMGSGDPECGPRYAYSTARSIFNRWKAGSVSDADTSRLDLETARIWRIQCGGGNAHYFLNLLITYHTITYTVSGTVSGSGGGTVNLSLCRAATGEVVQKTTRTGNGSYSFTWFDNTENMYVTAYEDATHTGGSAQGAAS